MPPPRFYAPDLNPEAGRVTLDDDESRHLRSVLRLGPGDRALVFDGRGTQMLAEVAAVSRRGATLQLIERAPAAGELPARVTLAQAVLKGDAMDHLVRDATMLGVSAIRPVRAARTIVPARAAGSRPARDRWHRIAVASAKQCGRAVVPVLLEPIALEGLFAAEPASRRLMLVEPRAGGPAQATLDGTPTDTTLLSGPEGGWTTEELEAAAAGGFTALSLGPLTLRAETAPLAALAIMGWLWTRARV